MGNCDKYTNFMGVEQQVNVLGISECGNYVYVQFVEESPPFTTWVTRDTIKSDTSFIGVPIKQMGEN